jgi:hypothetical protein
MHGEHHQLPITSRRNAELEAAQLATAIDEIVSELEDDWDRRGMICTELAERLHFLREAARLSAGDPA